MRSSSAVVSFVVSFALLLARPSSAATERFAVVLGNNVGHDVGSKLRFAESDARKFYNVLADLGGFRRHHLRLLLGASAQQAWEAIRTMAARAERFGRRAGTKTLLLLYYSGHADGDVLELGSTSLDFRKLAAFFRTPGATVRLGFVDSCKSGKLVSVKGGRRGPTYAINLTEDLQAAGYAIVTSSADNELSQEAAEIRGSFFSHYLVSGLRGAADASGDGQVTLAEAYRFAYLRTVARTAGSLSGTQHPMYQFGLAGRGEIVLTRPTAASSRLSVASETRGRLVVLDASGQTMIAERTLHHRDGPARLALAPGRYLAYLIDDQQVRRRALRLTRGQTLELKSNSFRDHSPRVAVSKGGLFLRRQPRIKHRLGAGFLLRGAALRTNTVALGACTSYEAMLRSGWLPTAQLCWAAAADSEASSSYQEVGGSAGLGYGWTLGSLVLRISGLLGYEHLFQHRSDTPPLDSSGLFYLAQGGIGFGAGPLLASFSPAIGGRMFQMQPQGWVHRLDLRLLAGLNWTWPG